jgi:hypothetical protein
MDHKTRSLQFRSHSWSFEAMDWAAYRRYRHIVVWLLVGLAGILMVSWPEHPAAWIGAACVGLLGIAYLIEEIAWRLQGLGRPCPHGKQLEAILTDAQKKQWKELLGPPFDLGD